MAQLKQVTTCQPLLAYYQPTQTQQCARRLTLLVIGEVCFHNLVVEPQMWDNHSVLCQSSRLIRTYRSCWTQSLNCLQVLDQTVFVGHPLCSDSQWYLWQAQSKNLNRHFI